MVLGKVIIFGDTGEEYGGAFQHHFESIEDATKWIKRLLSARK